VAQEAVSVHPVVVLAGLVVEWCLTGRRGRSAWPRDHRPLLFYPAHLAIFLFSIPALANLLVLARPAGRWGGGSWQGMLCAALDLPVVLTQYVVTESALRVEARTVWATVKGTHNTYQAPLSSERQLRCSPRSGAD